MNKPIIITALIVSLSLFHLALNTKSQTDALSESLYQIKLSNQQMERQIHYKNTLSKSKGGALSDAYRMFMNQVRDLQNNSAISMRVQLANAKDSNDISQLYVPTAYKGVRGIKIKIIVDGISGGTDMGLVLDNIHHLERNSDFLVNEISKDNNDLIVKGELYGL